MDSHSRMHGYVTACIITVTTTFSVRALVQCHYYDTKRLSAPIVHPVSPEITLRSTCATVVTASCAADTVKPNCIALKP